MSPHPEHNRGRGEAQILARPHIVDEVLGPLGPIPQPRDLGKHQLHVLCLLVGVEQEDVHAPDRLASPVVGGVGVIADAVPLVRHGAGPVDGVLVEGDELLVLQNIEDLGPDRVQLGADDERALEGGPQGKVAAVLLDGEVAVADLHHVPVVVAPEVGRVPVEGRLVEYGHQRQAILVRPGPGRVDVAVHAPAVAGVVPPCDHIGMAPDA